MKDTLPKLRKDQRTDGGIEDTIIRMVNGTSDRAEAETKETVYSETKEVRPSSGDEGIYVDTSSR